MRALTAKGWGTIAAIAVLIAVVIAAFASSTGVRGARAPTPVESGLNACRDLGAAAENDAVCHATWRWLSEHFLGLDRKAGGHE